MIDVRSVKLYGGHLHGDVVNIDIFKSWRLEVRKPDPMMCRFGPLSPDSLMPNYESGTTTYYLERYQARFICPHRYRERWFGQVEGTELLVREAYELQRDLETMPWEFPGVSILTEFEDWWSQQIYKRTDKMTWAGEVIRS